MFVTLKENIPGLGKAGDIVKVSDSYARNFLIPSKKAFIGKQEAFRVQQVQTHQPLSRETVLDRLGKGIAMSMPANESGGLYKKISPKELQRIIGERIGTAEKLVKLNHQDALHAIGSYQVPFVVQGESFTASISITRKQ